MGVKNNGLKSRDLAVADMTQRKRAGRPRSYNKKRQYNVRDAVVRKTGETEAIEDYRGI